MRRAVGLLLASAVAGAGAHGFDERYDLPVPLAWVVAGACAVVALTFAAAALFALVAPGSPTTPRRSIALCAPRPLHAALRGLGLALFMLTLAAALWGSQDPLMNLAPTLVWIIAWLGLAFASALLGGLWTLLDPWRTVFDALDAAARRLGRAQGLGLGWRYPTVLGQWPAVLLLLAWCWLEVIDPLASTPERLGAAMLVWTGVNVTGMAAFGAATWQARADVFAVFFGTLARLAPLRLRRDPGTGTGTGTGTGAGAGTGTGADNVGEAPPAAGRVAFVMAMLSTVVFDGLHGGAGWFVFEGLLRRTVPQWLDVNGRVAGTLGLLAVWLVFLLAYTAMAGLSRALMRPATLSAPTLALTLVPIALAYDVAHNFSSLLIQGQRVFALMSDPFGRQWDLFGTARWYPDIGIVDARTTWFVALLAIVGGHMASIWRSHRVVLAAGVPPRRAALAMLPLTLLMVGCTALSLLLIGAPMVAGPPP